MNLNWLLAGRQGSRESIKVDNWSLVMSLTKLVAPAGLYGALKLAAMDGVITSFKNYTDGDSSNVFIKEGLLHIIAKKDAKAPKGYSSVRMNQNKGFLYGRLEVRAKLPPGRGLWPAIWLMPDKASYGGWPKSGEIDLMENVGYAPDSVHFTIHTEKYNHVKGTQKAAILIDSTLYSRFHDYALEWSPDSLVFFMDDKKVFTYENEHMGYQSWPYDKAFHLILNVAVGGDWGGKMGVDSSVFPATMLVDYVRVFK